MDGLENNLDADLDRDVDAPGEKETPTTVPIDDPARDPKARLTEKQVAALKQIRDDFKKAHEKHRKREIRDSREAREFWGGNHYLVWDDKKGLYRDALELQSEFYPQDQDPPSAYTDNFYLGYGLDYIAVVAANPFRTLFWPKNAESIRDLIASERAGLLCEHVRKQNNEHGMTQQQAYFYWTDGWAAAYVRWVADGLKYGTRKVPVMETQIGELQPAMARCFKCGWEGPAQAAGGPCPACRAVIPPDSITPPVTGPQEVPVGEETLPNARLEVDILGRLEVRVPPSCTKITEFPYLIYPREIPRARAMAMAPDLRSKLRTGTTESRADGGDAYEISARRQLSEGENDAFAAKQSCFYESTWLAPWALELVPDDAIRAELQEIFPTGVYFSCLDDHYFQHRDESMSKHWVQNYAQPGTGEATPTVGGPLIELQKPYNELLNIEIDSARFGVSAIFVNPKTVDVDAWGSSRVQPAAMYAAKPRAGMPMGADFFATPTSSTSPQAVRLREEMAGPRSQHLCGITPSVWGGVAEGAGETSSGYAQMRQQAEARLRLTKGNLTKLNEGIDELIFELFKEDAYEDLVFPEEGPGGQFRNQVISLNELQGDVVIKSSSDDAIPVTPHEKRKFFMDGLQNPALGQILMSPDNSEFARAATQMRELKMPFEQAFEQQSSEIEELLQGAPTSPIDPMTGQPALNPMTGQPLVVSTVPVNVELDDHVAGAMKCKLWAQSRAGMRARVENPQGFANVQAHKEEHDRAQMQVAQKQAAMQMAAMPPQPAPGPGGPPKE